MHRPGAGQWQFQLFHTTTALVGSEERYAAQLSMVCTEGKGVQQHALLAGVADSDGLHVVLGPIPQHFYTTAACVWWKGMWQQALSNGVEDGDTATLHTFLTTASLQLHVAGAW